MKKATANAEQVVRSVLGEAFTGGTARVLSKYQLLDPSGELRQVTVKFPPGDVNGQERTGPIINPAVLERFLALDTSNNKRLFDWMIFASGGGEPHRRESERALDLAKNWVIENRMKGKGRNDEDIKPMTRQEAEADWMANDYQKYHLAYFFADQDLAGDKQYPVFGWYMDWPGRNNVYQKIVDAVSKWKALAGDKKFVQSFNKANPKEPFQLDFWEADGKPRWKDVDALADFVSQVKAIMARRKAEQNVVTVGKIPKEQGGGYRTGSDEVLYEDDIVKVVVPLTAAASMKKGYNDWCISNKSRWEEYFRNRQQGSLQWGNYTQRGPFAFMHLKVPTHDRYLQSLAAHVQIGCPGASGLKIEWWDRENTHTITSAEIRRRMEATAPGRGGQSFDSAVREIQAWVASFKSDQLERYPSLEAMARQLVASLLD